MNQKLKRYRIDYDGEKVFHEGNPNGEHVLYSDIAPLIEASKFAIADDMWVSDGQFNERFEYKYKDWYQDRLREALKKLGIL